MFFALKDKCKIMELNMKLIVADDHALFRDLFSQFVKSAEPDAEIVQCTSADEVKDLLSAQNGEYDLVIMDWMMPGVNGLDTFRELFSGYPDVSFAIMSGVIEQRHIKDIMDLGAVAYFPKTMSSNSFLKAIELVLTGERFYPVLDYKSSLQPSYFGDRPKHLSEAQDKYDFKSKKIKLTRRENDVLGHLVKGETNKEIALALELQIVTIKLHVRGICKKLNAQNRTQAALMAQELGLFIPD
jgi:DNA-binding NarL/FixJ family response regulator